MRFYTWKDIERYILLHCTQWNSHICDIDVYPDEIIVYSKDNSYDMCKKVLHDLFPKNLSNDGSKIKLDYIDSYIKVSYECGDIDNVVNIMPLFKKAIYQESAYPNKRLEELSCPVIGFHSYKGGVGRTLSLIAFAQAWTNMQNDPQNNKLLIIDSDIEAPGLTLIQGKLDEISFSYLDLLTLIQDNSDEEKVLSIAANLIGNLTIPIETKQEKVKHIFLPTYRYEQQLYDLYASPQSITNSRNKEYVLAEILSSLAVKLGAKAVLIDLRAGISEYSAPLLLDPRVKKYCVTSTSSQSVIGTKKILNFISKGLDIDSTTLLPTILLSMVPKEFPQNEKEAIKEKMISCFKTTEDNEELFDNMVIELPFASELIHLTSLQQILFTLKDREMYETIYKLVEQNYKSIDKEETFYSEEQHRIVLKQIYEFANNQITAEANGAEELLLTEPIKNLCGRFNYQIPTTIVQGAKGSGKTFLYRQLIEQKSWRQFCSKIDSKKLNSEDGYFIPVLAPQNISKIKILLDDCIDSVNNSLDFANVSRSIYVDNAYKLSVLNTGDMDWMKLWESIFVSSIDKNLSSLSELNDKLMKINKSVIFLIDGLEEIFKTVSADEWQQKAIEVLCQGILNTLASKYENIGLIVFLRSDMAQNAITVNYEQFRQTFDYAELKWSSEEALKLAVWLVDQAVPDFYRESVPIENASQEIVEKYLIKLWGLKLGKNSSNEAYASRWILAALSDFNGQLQARDIIRFLKYASKQNGKKPAYFDRVLMPVEIRNAVSNCSMDKINDIKTEYESLKPIFEKLEELPPEKKHLPISQEENLLSAQEEKLMKQAGYLTREGDNLYLPEIIRHALGFRYERGARPRVLALILSK